MGRITEGISGFFNATTAVAKAIGALALLFVVGVFVAMRRRDKVVAIKARAKVEKEAIQKMTPEQLKDDILRRVQ